MTKDNGSANSATTPEEGKKSEPVPDAIIKRYSSILNKLVDPECSLNIEYLLDLFISLALDENMKKSLGSLVDENEELVNLIFERISINDFKIMRKLGSGAFGVVYLVMEKSSHNYYALKRSEKQNIDATDKSFITEKRIMMDANSPWMPNVYFCFHNQRYIYYVMELFAGGTVESYVDSFFPIEEDMCKILSAQMLSGIHATHEMGYIHRDIKPENFLITSNGIVKIGDFGLARPLDANKEWFSTKPAGTPNYMSPELYESIRHNDIRNFTLATDYWAFGICIFELRYGYTLYFEDEDKGYDVQVAVLAHNPDKINMNPLEDPDASEFSENYTNLIYGLLKFEKERFGYKECINSAFLKEINFDTLHTELSPITPELNPDLFKERPDDIKEFQKSKHAFSNSSNFLFSGFTESMGNVLHSCFKEVFGLTDQGSGLSSLSNEQITELKSQLDSLNDSYKQVVHDFETELDQKNKLSADLKNLRASLIEQESVSKSFEEKLSSKTKETENLKSQIDKLSSQKKESENTISELTEKIKKKEKENFDVAAQLELNISSSKALKSDIESLKNSLASAESEKSKLNEKVNESMRKISTQQSLESSLASLSQNEKQLIGKVSELEITILELTSLSSNLEKDLKEKIESSLKLQSEVNEGKETLSKIKLDLNSVNQEYNTTLGELDEKKKKIKQLEEDSTDALNKLQNVNAELDETKENSLRLQNEIKLKEVFINDKLSEIEQLKSEASEVNRLKKKVAKYKLKNHEVSHKYSTTKDLLDKTVSSKSNLLKEMETINEDKNTMKSDYEIKLYNLRNEMSALAQQKSQLMNFIHTLESQGKLSAKSNKHTMMSSNSNNVRKLEGEKSRLQGENKKLKSALETSQANSEKLQEQISLLNQQWVKKVEAKDKLNHILRRKVEMLGGNVDSQDLIDAEAGPLNTENIEKSNLTSSFKSSSTISVVNKVEDKEKIDKILSSHLNAFKNDSKTVINFDFNVWSTTVYCQPEKVKFSQMKNTDKWPISNLIIDVETRTIILVLPDSPPYEYECSNVVAMDATQTILKSVPKNSRDKSMVMIFGTGKIVNNNVAVPVHIPRSDPIKQLTLGKPPTKYHILNPKISHRFTTVTINEPYVRCLICKQEITSLSEKSIIGSQCKNCNLYIHQHHLKETDFIKNTGSCNNKGMTKILVFDSQSEKYNWMTLINAAHAISPVKFT